MSCTQVFLFLEFFNFSQPLSCSPLYLQGDAPERLVSGSDDFTLFLWHPEVDKKSIARLTGHQQLINEVKFSPDTRLLASASFDKSVKLWDGKTGKYEKLFNVGDDRVHFFSKCNLQIHYKYIDSIRK